MDILPTIACRVATGGPFWSIQNPLDGVVKPRNDMRERKGEAMRVRKEPTQKRRGGVSDLSRLSAQALNAR